MRMAVYKSREDRRSSEVFFECLRVTGDDRRAFADIDDHVSVDRNGPETDRLRRDRQYVIRGQYSHRSDDNLRSRRGFGQRFAVSLKDRTDVRPGRRDPDPADKIRFAEL